MGFFEECGVPLKVERGERVFPVSDRSADIVQALVDKARQLGCRLVHGCADALLIGEERVEGVSLTDGQKLYAHSVIGATGGKSYPATGSTGDGYRLAKQAGHRVTPLRPSLIPLDVYKRQAYFLFSLFVARCGVGLLLPCLLYTSRCV